MYRYEGIKIMIKQCKWECPECGLRCGGVIFHSGEHQCPRCYKGKFEK